MTASWNGWLPDGGLLEGKVALVAGGAGGIGEATSRIMAAAGASVAVLDRDAEQAAAVTKTISESGGTALPITGDLHDEASCQAAIERVVGELGGIDVLANVAGGMSAHAPWRPITEWPTDTWDHISHLNQRYVFWMCRGAIPVMAARGGGAIVNVTSIAGSFGSPGQSAYGAAKAGLIQFTKTLAIECGPAGIRANAVSPGVTMTATAEATITDETRATLLGSTPLRRLCRPEDIARTVLVFASPMTEGVTGQMVGVDGGVSINFPYPSLGHQ
jgi:NAD(P)-dependent dehydrogenase (short-subunit alcohol dehydrogenase family)